jgi:hypothetical protein
MMSGVSLSDAACDALFQAACKCVHQEKHQAKVVNDDVAGAIHTEFEFGMSGAISGILFEGEIETEKGHSKVKFVVNPNDLEEAHKGKWVSFSEFLEVMARRKKDAYKHN